MKKVSQRFITALVFLAMFLSPGASKAKSEAMQVPSEGQVEVTLLLGRVIDAPEQLKIQAFSAEGKLVSETYTGLDGQFKFSPLPRGEYHLQVVDERGHRLEMRREAQVDRLPGGQAERIEITLRPVTPPLEVENTATAEVPPVDEDIGIPQADGTGQISGTVTAASGGNALASVWVTAYTSRTATTYVAFDLTDLSGKYALTGLADGDYYVKFERADYLTSYYNGKGTLAEANPATVSGGGLTGNINAALVLGGRINGKVTAAADSAPLQNVTVSLYSSNSVEESKFDASHTTDGTGTYSFTGLAAGTYYMRFSKADYMTVFHSDKPSLAEADGVSVTLGGTTTINAALVLGGKISGTVTAAVGGLPLQSAEVRLYSSNTVEVYNYDSLHNTDGNGAYAFTGLGAGTYYLRFSKTDYLTAFYDGKSNLAEADEVSVILGGTKTINASLVLGGKISGTVTEANQGKPLGNASVYAYTSQSAGINDYMANASTDANGKYTLGGLETGTYYIRFAAADYLSSYYNGKASLAEADEVNTVVNTETKGINASLVLGGKISGTVTAAASGKPLANAGVYAYSSRSASDYDYHGYTDASGVYTLNGLPAGTYYLKYEATDYLTRYYNEQESLAKADGVSVTLGDTRDNINAALTLGGKISGKVTAEGSGTPLKDVQVSVYTSSLVCGGRELAYVAAGITDSEGNYTITSLETGNYAAFFSPLGHGKSAAFLNEYYNNRDSVDSSDLIGVTAGETTGNINAALAFGGAITGKVTVADVDAGLQDVDVYVYNSSSRDWVDDELTNDSGEYTVPGLETGKYLAYFHPLDHGKSAVYLDEYYDSKTGINAADPIDVTVGQTTVDISAALTKGGTIKGKVTAANGGKGLDDIDVKVYSSPGDTLVDEQPTDVYGNYTVAGLPEGDYYVTFNPTSSGKAANYIAEYYNDKAKGESADIINVGPGALVDDIDAVLERGGQFIGQVTAADGESALGGVLVQAYDSQDILQGSDYTDTNGVYITNGLASGSYRLEFSPASGNSVDYLGEFYNDQSTLDSADPVALTAPEKTTVDAVLGRSGSISGRVTSSETGDPLKDVEVTVLDADEQEVNQALTDDLGQYALRALPSGTYHMHFKLTICASNYEVYYNQKPTLATADHVIVTAPELTPNINGQLPYTYRCYVPLVMR